MHFRDNRQKIIMPFHLPSQCPMKVAPGLNFPAFGGGVIFNGKGFDERRLKKRINGILIQRVGLPDAANPIVVLNRYRRKRYLPPALFDFEKEDSHDGHHE